MPDFNTGRPREALEKITAFLGKAVKTAAGFLAVIGGKLLPKLKNFVPSLLLGAVIFGFLYWTGLADKMSVEIAALTGSVPVWLIIFAVSLIPALSSVLGPGLLIAIAAGILTGEQIAGGKSTPFLALAALLAIDAQIGGSFIPPSLGMGETERETISAGVPAIVFTRLVTVPIAVVLVCLFSFL